MSLKNIAAALAASCGCLLPGASYAVSESSPLQVQLPAGTVEGTSLTANGTELRAFKGIPYAAPPVGVLRWKEPQPVAQWAGVRHATQFGPRCMQLAALPLKFRSENMSEDCLYLPNGPALPTWPAVRESEGALLRQAIGASTNTISDTNAARHAFLHAYLAQAAGNTTSP